MHGVARGAQVPLPEQTLNRLAARKATPSATDLSRPGEGGMFTHPPTHAPIRQFPLVVRTSPRALPSNQRRRISRFWGGRAAISWGDISASCCKNGFLPPAGLTGRRACALLEVLPPDFGEPRPASSWRSLRPRLDGWAPVLRLLGVMRSALETRTRDPTVSAKDWVGFVPLPHQARRRVAVDAIQDRGAPAPLAGSCQIGLADFLDSATHPPRSSPPPPGVSGARPGSACH